MAAALDICNSALIKLGSTSIISLSGTDKKSVTCNLQYPISRDYVLTAHPWSFAIGRVSLAAFAGTPAFEYANWFSLPAGCLRALSVDLDEDQPWKIESNLLLCNSSAVNLKYIKQVTDTTQFTSTFNEVLALHVAANIAYSITQSTTAQTAMMNAYIAALRECRSYDSQQGSVDQMIANDFITIRS